MSSPLVPVTLGAPRFTETKVPGFRIYDAFFAPRLRLPRHYHDRSNLAIVLGGSFDLIVKPRTHACRVGSVCIEPAGDTHANRMENGGAEVLVIQPDHDLRSSAAKALFEERGFFAKSPVIGKARRLAQELKHVDSLTPLMIEGLTLEILASLSRSQRSFRESSHPRWLRNVEDLLHDRFLDTPRVSEIAREANVHPVHLTRVFRSKHGVTVADFLRKLRVEWACDELRSSSDSIATIALRAGFADQSHFTRIFRKHTGWTPERYRRHAGRRGKPAASRAKPRHNSPSVR